MRALTISLLAGFFAACSGSAGSGSGDANPLGGASSSGGSASAGGSKGKAGSGTFGDAPNQDEPYDEGPLSLGEFEETSPSVALVDLDDDPIGQCLVALEQPPLPETLAEPEVVWSRISRFVFDEVVEPPAALPSKTSAAWAGLAALSALSEAQQLPGGAPGIRRFLTGWIQVDRDVIFEQNWSQLLDGPAAAPSVLLTTPLLEMGRVGIFSEVPFLTAHPSIPQRGAGLSWALFLQDPPMGPPNSNVPVLPVPGQTRRQATESALAEPGCHACHASFDPLGFSLEHFDELGRYRDFDAGQPVNSFGELSLALGVRYTFMSFGDLAGQAALACQTNAAFASSVFAEALVAAELSDGALKGPLSKGPRVPPEYELDDGYLRFRFLLDGKPYRSLVKGIAQSRPFLQP